MTSWSKEEIKISDGTKVLAQMPVIVKRRSAFSVGCEVSLKESFAALAAAQKSLMNFSFNKATEGKRAVKEESR